MSDIFISYAREDEARARDLAVALEQYGWSVWYDRALIPSEEFDERIEQELDTARCVIVIWSQASIKSRWVRAEAGAADDEGKLIPIAFEADILPPLRFRQLNIAKLSTPTLHPPTGEVYSLLTEIAAATGKPPKGMAATGPMAARAGGRSGARTVTPGRWLLSTRFLLARAVYDLELLPSGIASGSGAWAISRVRLSGRWHYDSSRQILELELSGGISQGIEAMAVQITGWKDDDTATCTVQGRQAELKRVPPK